MKGRSDQNSLFLSFVLSLTNRESDSGRPDNLLVWQMAGFQNECTHLFDHSLVRGHGLISVFCGILCASVCCSPPVSILWDKEATI